jgi:hypothetical protein
MKKIAVFIAVGLMLIAVSSSAQRVTIRNNRHYDVRIDGRYYSNNNSSISYLSPGYHRVQVYQIHRGGFLGMNRRRILVSSSNFYLGNNDVVINIDRFGDARINQYGNMANGNRYGRGMNRRYYRNYNNNYQ